jgi:hypothetical protein
MDNNLPAAAFGHFIMKVNDISVTHRFYESMGLRSGGTFPDLAIIELRGGTHILIFDKNAESPFPLEASHIGQRGGMVSERLDLMIEGKAKSDLEKYRASLINNGLPAEEIAQDKFFGHYYFRMVDPDGNGITVYTSHVGDLPV